MKFIRHFNWLLFFAMLPFLLSFNSCRNIPPMNQILNLYMSPKIGEYMIQKVALLPMAQDDTTDSGTFYSTNHFFNELRRNYPNMEFVVPPIDVANEYDTLILSFINDVEKLKKLDLKLFFDSQVGYSVGEENLDAILIGRIDTCETKTGLVSGGFAFVTSCEFRYYLISLVDGRVLWKANILGEGDYPVVKHGLSYPPLDYAISNGIDKIITSLPFH